jgi:hypothetical protein
MSKEDIKQAAAQLFASTTHDVLWVNPKGEFFTSENIGSLSLETGQKLEKFERTPEKEVIDTKGKTLNQGETIAEILKVENIEGLKIYELDERKGVNAAYTDQLAKLTEAIPVIGATVVNGNADTETKK